MRNLTRDITYLDRYSTEQKSITYEIRTTGPKEKEEEEDLL